MKLRDSFLKKIKVKPQEDKNRVAINQLHQMINQKVNEILKSRE